MNDARWKRNERSSKMLERNGKQTKLSLVHFVLHAFESTRSIGWYAQST